MAQKDETTLFTYTDKDGVDVVVDRLDDVPMQYRGKMKITTLGETTAEVRAPTKEEVKAKVEQLAQAPLPFGLEPLSIASGAFVGILFGFLVGFGAGKAGGSRRIVSAVVTMTVLALVATIYAAYGRRSPVAVINDTHRAKQLMETHRTSQQKALEEIERSEK